MAVGVRNLGDLYRQDFGGLTETELAACAIDMQALVAALNLVCP